MRYVCIRCGDTWTVDEPTGGPSGGLCDRCFTAYIRGKQRSQGLHDCFKKASTTCSDTVCSYWAICNRQLINSYEEK